MELEEKTQELISLPAATALVDAIFALDVSQWTDRDFAALEHVIDKALQLIAANPSAEHRPLIERLLVAREGTECGVAPDPMKRPTVQQMRQFVADHL